MRTETKEYTVYDYNDLLANKELKERVLKENWDINIEYIDWWIGIYDNWDSYLESLGFIHPQVEEFDIGRGYATFSCKNINLIELFDSNDFKEFIGNQLTDKELKTLRELYNHGLIDNFSCERGYYNDLNPIKHHKKLDIVDKFDMILHEFIEELHDELYNLLRDEYTYLTSEEAILETLQINGYEFLEDGTIA